MKSKQELEKRKAIRAYFSKFPMWTVFVIGFGVLMLAVGSWGAAVFGVLLIASGAIPLYLRHKGMITDAKYDQFLAEDIDNIIGVKSLQKWGIDQSELIGDPSIVYVYGPVPEARALTAASKRGKDGLLRYNPIRFAVIGFGEDQLFAYLGILDVITGDVVNESTEEFFYQDVVSVSTATQSIRVIWKGASHYLNDTETFMLTTSGGTAIQVPIRSPQWARILGGGEIPSTLAERAITAVRATLRTKKRLPASASGA